MAPMIALQGLVNGKQSKYNNDVGPTTSIEDKVKFSIIPPSLANTNHKRPAAMQPKSNAYVPIPVSETNSMIFEMQGVPHRGPEITAPTLAVINATSPHVWVVVVDSSKKISCGSNICMNLKKTRRCVSMARGTREAMAVCGAAVC